MRALLKRPRQPDLGGRDAVGRRDGEHGVVVGPLRPPLPRVTGDREERHERHPLLPAGPEEVTGVRRRADTEAVLHAHHRCDGLRLGQVRGPDIGDAQVADEAGVAQFGQHTEVLGDRVDRVGAQVHQVEENLRQLGRDHLDLVNLRAYPVDSIAEHFGVLAGLRDAGLIRHLGVSSVGPAHLAQAQAIAPVVCVQNRYGIGAPPEAREFLRACGQQGVAFVPFFAIAGQGRERGTPDSEHDEVHAIAAAHGATSAQVRLAWTLQQGPHVLAIPGTGNPDHLAANVAAAALRLSPGEMARLEAIS